MCILNLKFSIYPFSNHNFLVSLSLFCKKVHLYNFFKITYISDIIRYFSFSGLLYLVWSSLGPSMLLQISFAALSLFSQWLRNIPLIYVPLLYPFTCWWTFRLLHVLAIVNSAAMSIEVHVSFWIKVFFFSGYILRSGVAGSNGNFLKFF